MSAIFTITGTILSKQHVTEAQDLWPLMDNKIIFLLTRLYKSEESNIMLGLIEKNFKFTENFT